MDDAAAGPARDLWATLGRRRSVRDWSDAPVDGAVLSRVIGAAFVETDDAGRRAAPSAHALYPVRAVVAVGRVAGLAPGAYGWVAGSLVQQGTRDLRPALRDAAIDRPDSIGRAAAVVTLLGDMPAAMAHFADQRPYGLRGERYLWIEAGAIAQTILLAAAAEALGAVLIAGFHDEATADALALGSPDVPLMHLCIGHPA